MPRSPTSLRAATGVALDGRPLQSISTACGQLEGLMTRAAGAPRLTSTRVTALLQLPTVLAFELELHAEFLICLGFRESCDCPHRRAPRSGSPTRRAPRSSTHIARQRRAARCVRLQSGRHRAHRPPGCTSQGGRAPNGWPGCSRGSERWTQRGSLADGTASLLPNPGMYIPKGASCGAPDCEQPVLAHLVRLLRLVTGDPRDLPRSSWAVIAARALPAARYGRRAAPVVTLAPRREITADVVGEHTRRRIAPRGAS
jgi:hypothetical protein